VTDRERDAIGDLRGAVEDLGEWLKSHELQDQSRHDAQIGRFDDLSDTIKDLRAERARTLVTVVSEWGADAVPIPLTSGRELKLRTLIALVGVAVGSLLALGWAGPAASWIDAYFAKDANAATFDAPPDAATAPEPTR
jgi:hypothetical protein